MALLFHDGFDAGDPTQKWNSNTGFTTSTTTRFSTGRSASISGGGIVSLRKNFAAASKVICGFAFRTSTVPTVGFLSFAGDGNTIQHANLQLNNSGSISALRGGTVVATSAAGLITANTWYWLEVSATVDDSTGRIVVRLNGNTTPIIDFTGDTRNGGTNLTLDSVQLSSFAIGTDTFYDDFYLLDGTGSAPNNDFLGDVRVHTLVGTGAGNSTQFTPSTGSNWACTDELPYSATDYVSSTTTGHKDTYATADLPAGVGTIYGVQVCAVAKKTDAGSRSLKTVVRRGSTDYSDSTATTLTTGDATVIGMRAVDPSTSAAWTVTNVNAMEIGVEVA